MFSTLLRFSSLAGTTKNQYSNGNTFLYPKVGLMFDTIGLPVYDSKGKITVAPPQLDASGQSLLQGATQTLQLSLKDLAYNPTYAIEINKNFNYVPGSYKIIRSLRNGCPIMKSLKERQKKETVFYGFGLLAPAVQAIILILLQEAAFRLRRP